MTSYSISDYMREFTTLVPQCVKLPHNMQKYDNSSVNSLMCLKKLIDASGILDLVKTLVCLRY